MSTRVAYERVRVQMLCLLKLYGPVHESFVADLRTVFFTKCPGFR